VLILSRSATAVASETAVMKLSQEIESLEIMGIPALEFVFLPRIIGGGLSSFCANIIFLTAAFLGSFFMLNLRTSFSLWEFFLQMAHPLNRAEIFIFFAKSIISGLGIFWIACNHGLSLHLGRHEVPVRIVSGVVSGLKFILILELFSLFLYYGVY